MDLTKQAGTSLPLQMDDQVFPSMDFFPTTEYRPQSHYESLGMCRGIGSSPSLQSSTQDLGEKLI